MSEIWVVMDRMTDRITDAKEEGVPHWELDGQKVDTDGQKVDKDGQKWTKCGQRWTKSGQG